MTNSNSNTTTSSGGVGALGLIFAVLFVLKVAGLNGASWGLANLSWWIVFAPIFIGIALVVVFLLIALIVFVFLDK